MSKKGYWIAMVDVRDPETYKQYVEANATAFAKYGATFPVRAGRYMNDGTFGVTGECEPFEDELVNRVESHRYDPVKVLQWRNAALHGALQLQGVGH